MINKIILRELKNREAGAIVQRDGTENMREATRREAIILCEPTECLIKIVFAFAQTVCPVPTH